MLVVAVRQGGERVRVKKARIRRLVGLSITVTTFQLLSLMNDGMTRMSSHNNNNLLVAISCIHHHPLRLFWKQPLN